MSDNMWDAREMLLQIGMSERREASAMLCNAAMRLDETIGSKRHDINSDLVALDHISHGFFDHYPVDRWNRLTRLYA